MATTTTETGELATLTIGKHDLIIELTREGCEVIGYIASRPWPPVRKWWELLGDQYIEGGWELVDPAEVGALTDAPILSDEIERDDDGEIVKVGRLFWFTRYQLEDPFETLVRTEQIVFDRAE